MPMRTASIIRLRKFSDDNGTLCVYQGGSDVPFQIRRVFSIRAKVNDIRGNHAHKQCTQMLVCLAGRIRVTCDNGHESAQYVLDDMDSGLLIPPQVWASQQYLEDDSVLMVLCDRDYEEEDYIRDYRDFSALAAQV
jgi:dTDP-4-dehydrorhamnose 3,5-epimerase-like enzyme